MRSFSKITAIYIYHSNSNYYISPFTRKLYPPVKVIKDSDSKELIKVLDEIINQQKINFNESNAWDYIYDGTNVHTFPNAICYVLLLNGNNIQALKSIIDKRGEYVQVNLPEYKGMSVEGIFLKDDLSGKYDIPVIVKYFLDVGKDLIEKKVEKKYEIEERPGKIEAIKWLMDLDNSKIFGANRFDSHFDGLKFVKNLYNLGALYIELIVDKQDPQYQIVDTINIFLPEDQKKRENLFKVINSENVKEGAKPESDTGQEFLSIWWD